jgi:hypothetical protein
MQLAFASSDEEHPSPVPYAGSLDVIACIIDQLGETSYHFLESTEVTASGEDIQSRHPPLISQASDFILIDHSPYLALCQEELPTSHGGTASGGGTLPAVITYRVTQLCTAVLATAEEQAGSDASVLIEGGGLVAVRSLLGPSPLVLQDPKVRSVHRGINRRHRL